MERTIKNINVLLIGHIINVSINLNKKAHRWVGFLIFAILASSVAFSSCDSSELLPLFRHVANLLISQKNRQFKFQLYLIKFALSMLHANQPRRATLLIHKLYNESISNTYRKNKFDSYYLYCSSWLFFKQNRTH